MKWYKHKQNEYIGSCDWCGKNRRIAQYNGWECVEEDGSSTGEPYEMCRMCAKRELEKETNNV